MPKDKEKNKNKNKSDKEPEDPELAAARLRAAAASAAMLMRSIKGKDDYDKSVKKYEKLRHNRDAQVTLFQQRLEDEGYQPTSVPHVYRLIDEYGQQSFWYFDSQGHRYPYGGSFEGYTDNPHDQQSLGNHSVLYSRRQLRRLRKAYGLD
ncbi:hypothetical protein T439DRAFT_113452 [Meredithblackwellia eburnea MCA 4105]